MTNDIYRATMRFLSRMSTEMNDQHVLGLERLLLTSTILPLANEALLIGAHVVIIQVLKTSNLSRYNLRVSQTASKVIIFTDLF